ncbi:T9SS type A sorting domain-containing protein, partial [Arthrospira platensis SPKY1]|nr:T9SS type A sorting domain-containing protein [Arthrospira platensis SPKY1]
ENRSLGQAENEISNSMGLSVKAFPNPFSTEFDILVGMPEEGIVTVAVFNAAGQAVAFPCQEVRLPGGEHRFGLDGLNFPAGLYTVQIQTEKTSSALRIVKMY